ncbi:hypothetical protein ACQ86K_13610 [Mucilaginibacter sp. P19]|uniref:hypothetical protein n=1 Tax=Mucilaginibacter sp. P19 TaxID=3423947 RepID=UPI003D66FC34
MDGAIIDVYNSDMDVDGNPEILIQAKSKDTTNYTSIYAFEFNDNNSKANKLDFPKLTSSQRKGYRGNDNFYIKEGKLMREFSIFNGTGKDAKPSGAKRQLEYGLRGNEFTVKQLSKDSTDVKQPDNQPAKTDEKKSSDKQSSSSSSKSSKKKHKRHRG